jgi:hypothetical protein
MAAALIEIGFWRDERDAEDARPHPTALVDHNWHSDSSNEVTAVLAYLRAGFLHSYELGYSHCRFADCACAEPCREMGCATLTDGKCCINMLNHKLLNRIALSCARHHAPCSSLLVAQ